MRRCQSCCNVYHLHEMPKDSTSQRSGISATRLGWLINASLALLALVILMVVGILTPRAFGFLGLVIMCIFGVIYYRLSKNDVTNSTQTGTNPKLSQRTRWYILVARVLWLVLALWLIRERRVATSDCRSIVRRIPYLWRRNAEARLSNSFHIFFG
jgi:hypothetical protein